MEKGILFKPSIVKDVEMQMKELVPASLLEKYDNVRLAMKTDVEEQFRLTVVETAFGGKPSLRSRQIYVCLDVLRINRMLRKER